MGGSGILVSIADEDGGDADLARSARYMAFVLAATCPLRPHQAPRPARALLAHDAHREVQVGHVDGRVGPHRFLGTGNGGRRRAGRRRRTVPRFVTKLGPLVVTKPLLGILGAFITGYTGVLISATAIPVFGDRQALHPRVFGVLRRLRRVCGEFGRARVDGRLRAKPHQTRAPRTRRVARRTRIAARFRTSCGRAREADVPRSPRTQASHLDDDRRHRNPRASQPLFRFTLAGRRCSPRRSRSQADTSCASR